MKIHLSLATRDLDASVEFYRVLLDAEPAKRLRDYALFVTDSPALELALEPGSAFVDATVHYGLAVDSTSAVDDATRRLQKAGLPTDVETAETCCYAVQNKVWATDPDGRRWETYFVLTEAEQRSGAGTSCCSTEPGPQPVAS